MKKTSQKAVPTTLAAVQVFLRNQSVRKLSNINQVVNNHSAELIGTGDLKQRRWTEAMIKRFLGAADKLVPNRRFKSAAPIRLFSLERVVQIETTPDFLRAIEAATRRAEAGKKAAETRSQQLIRQIGVMTVAVEVLPKKQLFEHAINDYNDFKGAVAEERGDYDWKPANHKSDPAFLERIAVNYIRHNLTEYDEALEEIAGRTGVAIGVQMIRKKVFGAIAETYQWLADECRRQEARRSIDFFETSGQSSFLAWSKATR